MNIYLAILFWLHLLGMTIWLGASLLMPLAILPAVQELDPPSRGKFVAALQKRQVPLIYAAIAIVIVTGILQTSEVYKTYAILAGVNVLSVKTWVALLMIANGLYIGLVLSVRSTKLAPAPGTPPSPEFLKTQRSLGTHLWVQAGLSVIILFIVGLLTAR